MERVLLIGLGGATGTVLRYLLTESDTSGGLLFAAAGEPAADVADACRLHGAECWEIGEVLDEPVMRIVAETEGPGARTPLTPKAGDG